MRPFSIWGRLPGPKLLAGYLFVVLTSFTFVTFSFYPNGRWQPSAPPPCPQQAEQPTATTSATTLTDPLQASKRAHARARTTARSVSRQMITSVPVLSQAASSKVVAELRRELAAAQQAAAANKAKAEAYIDSLKAKPVSSEDRVDSALNKRLRSRLRDGDDASAAQPKAAVIADRTSGHTAHVLNPVALIDDVFSAQNIVEEEQALHLAVEQLMKTRTSSTHASTHGATLGLELTLAMLLMLQGDYKAALNTLDGVRRSDPFNFKAQQLRAYCLEAELKPEWGNELELMKEFNTSWAAQAPDYLQDFFWTMPKGYDGFKPHQRQHTRRAIDAISRLVTYHELVARVGGQANPYLRTLAISTGDGEAQVPRGLDVRELPRHFARDDVIVLRQLLAPYELRVVREYYRDSVPLMHEFGHRGGSGDPFVTSCTSDRVGYFLNQRLRPVIETVAGQPLQVSYSYMVKYYGFRGNPGLRPHTDQIDNEFTVTIAIDWEPDDFGPVPIYFGRERLKEHELGYWQQEPKDRKKVLLSFGDAMLFRGRRHAHFRPPFPLGKNSTNLLVHFVASDYPTQMNRWQHNQKFKDTR